MTKLAKDTFNLADLENVKNKISKLIIDFFEENKLVAFRVGYFPLNIMISNKYPSYDSKPVHNFRNLINNEFNLLDENNNPSHNISFHPPYKSQFYFESLKKLNEFEKIVFIKSMSDQRPNFKEFKPETGNISLEDFWLHFRHIAPFGTPKQNAHDVRVAISSLEDKTIDTEDKVISLAYFVKYNKTSCKRTDIKSGLSRLLQKKIDEKHFHIFESLLSIKLGSDNNDDDSFYLPSYEIKNLIISKEKIFTCLPFAENPQAQTQHYTSYFALLNKFLTKKEVKQKLNIERIDFCEFNSSKEPARVYIQSNENGFKEDIETIYTHLLKTCAHVYGKSSDILDNAFSTSLEYFFLERDIKSKNENNSTRHSTFKI